VTTDAHLADKAVPRARSRPRHLRAVLLVALAAWVGLGVGGVYLYVHRYDLYRGFPPPTAPPGVALGTTREVSFYSPALHSRESFLVHLPAGYAKAAARGRRFPVMYVLHGHPGLARNILGAGDIGTDVDTLVARHLATPMIIVLPEATTGPFAGGDTEWADTRFGRYDQAVVDFVHAVDRRFATRPRRGARIIAGLSSGAYGAVNVALHHLKVFGGFQSWSGYFVEDPNGVFKGASPALIAANSPADYVRSLAPQIRRLGLHAFVYVGRSDSVPRLSELPSFVAALRADGAKVQAAEFPGAHDWALWRREMPSMLAVASRWFQHPAHRGASLGSAAGRRALRRQQQAFVLAAHQRLVQLVARLRAHGIPNPYAVATNPQAHRRLLRSIRHKPVVRSRR
jgi:enterochelin esterase-like enzyme